MKLTRNLLLGVSIIGLFSTSCSMKQTVQADYEVVPIPTEIKCSRQTSFILKDGIRICYPTGNEQMKRNAEFLAQYVKEQTGILLTTNEINGEPGKGDIILSLGMKNDNKEAYNLTVNANNISISAPSEAGIFYGIQTLRKSIGVTQSSRVELSGVEINDHPEYGYRGMMLDVCRHFFTLDEVKTYLDIMALHNQNRLHLHLTEDQGWRVEIKKYPKLTEIGSVRKETVIGRLDSGKYDGKPYGGFYTQNELKELVAYAAERYITIIPEIDLPGHMQAALAAYPELGCTGGPYEVLTKWGVSDNVLCAGNDKTIDFLKDVLSEILQIFPSEYIHVGGDECPKKEWEKCAKCQAKARALGLRTDKHHTKEQRLQSYIMHEMEEYLNDNGRQLIGWDEILEGGLSPNSTVMSWRGEKGGMEAARQNHDVIMTPNSYVYFDYYQANDRDNEPLAIGGYLPMEKVYSYCPKPAGLTEAEQKHIVGVQANVWTEYMPNFEQVQYMILPRMAALSETQWPSQNNKDYEAFLKRMPRLIDIYDLHGWNYATHIFDVNTSITPNIETGVLNVAARTIDNAYIYYTLDGSEPTEKSAKYVEELKINKSVELKMTAIRANRKSRVSSDVIKFSKSTLKPVTLLQPTHKRYTFDGQNTLVDGINGNYNYKTGRWIGFYKNDMEAVIDLKEEMEVSSATINTCVEKGDWIFDARGMSVAVSGDNKAFKEVAAEDYPAMEKDSRNGVYTHKLKFEPVKARYVKVKAISEKHIPGWHGGKGKTGFLFVDEISVN